MTVSRDSGKWQQVLELSKAKLPDQREHVATYDSLRLRAVARSSATLLRLPR